MEHNLLMDAIIVENAKFAQLLIEHGADVTHKVIREEKWVPVALSIRRPVCG